MYMYNDMICDEPSDIDIIDYERNDMHAGIISKTASSATVDGHHHVQFSRPFALACGWSLG